MKKFKNNIGVTGPESLVKAWAIEVLKLGYSKGTEFDKKLKTIECNSAVTYRRNIGGGEVTFYKSIYPACQFLYNLPQDWDKALAKAAEVEEEIPEYVECTSGNKGSHYTGKIYKIEKGRISSESTGSPTPWRGFNSGRFEFKPSTKAAYDKQQEEFKMKELLEEAKKRYPVGTKFYSAVNPEIDVIATHAPKFNSFGNIGTIDKGDNGIVYSNGKWAEIVTKPEEEFVLPKKWFVQNPQNTESYLLYDYFNKGTESSWYEYGSVFAYPNWETGNGFLKGYHTCNIEDEEIKGYKEITFEQFKKYVLGKEEEPIEIAGYTAKFEEGKVSIGCYKDITLKDLKVLKKAIKLANKFSGFEVIEDSIIEGSENKMITLEEIEQLIERLDE